MEKKRRVTLLMVIGFSRNSIVPQGEIAEATSIASPLGLNLF